MTVRWARVVVGMLAITAIMFALGWLAGCSHAPCMYQGKAVGRRDAETMKKLGMPVQCPGDEMDAAPDFLSARK